MNRRWFVDENDLLLGRQLADSHDGVVFPGHPLLPEVPRGAKDDEWLSEVGRLGLVVITRDRRIRYRPVECGQWVLHRVRGFVLTGAGNMRTAEQLGLIGTHWRPMSNLVESHPNGPWMASVTRTGVRLLIEPVETDFSA